MAHYCSLVLASVSCGNSHLKAEISVCGGYG